MSISEFKGWQAYNRVEPFGAWRDNWHSATIAQILATVYGKKKVPLSDFMFLDEETRKANSDEAMVQWLDGKTGPTDEESNR